MKKLTIRLFLLVLLTTVLSAGCGGGSTSPTGPSLTPVAGYEWLVADEQPVYPDSATPRDNGPEDWRDEIIYMIMTDRFYDGNPANNAPAPYYNMNNPHGYHGGDFAGIVQKVDYIRGLGATAIWITPPVENTVAELRDRYPYYTSYHGYAAHDFQRIDSHLVDSIANNGMDDYKAFVDTMHSNGILLIQDIVVNHMGQLTVYPTQSDIWSPPFNASGYKAQFVEDYYKNASWVAAMRQTKPSPPFNDITSFSSCGPMRNYDAFPEYLLGDFVNLRDLNTKSSTVRNSLKAIYQNFITNAGVDGFRIDTARHVEDTFWNEFCPAMRQSANGKNFFQFGEVWDGYHPRIAYYTRDNRFDSLLNFHLYYAIQDVFINNKGTSLLSNELNLRSAYRQTPISGGGAEVAAGDSLVNFIDNHDMARFLTSARENRGRLWNALSYLMTVKGIPCIYYNTENEVTGSAADFGNEGRKHMPDFNTTGKRTFTLLRKLAKIRKENIALRRGEMMVLKDSPTAGIFAFVRYTGVDSENVFVFVNSSNKPIKETIYLNGYAVSGANLRNALSTEFNQEDVVPVNDSTVTVTVPPNNTKIYIIQ